MCCCSWISCCRAYHPKCSDTTADDAEPAPERSETKTTPSEPQTPAVVEAQRRESAADYKAGLVFTEICVEQSPSAPTTRAPSLDFLGRFNLGPQVVVAETTTKSAIVDKLSTTRAQLQKTVERYRPEITAWEREYDECQLLKENVGDLIGTLAPAKLTLKIAETALAETEPGKIDDATQRTLSQYVVGMRSLQQHFDDARNLLPGQAEPSITRSN